MKPNWKPLPHKVNKRRWNRQDDIDDESARKEIRRLDRHLCRVCGRRTNVVHEEKRRGAGGKVTPQNSYLACDIDTGGVCHPLLQGRHIYPRMADGSEVFHARADLVFEMTEKVAEIVFENRPRPAHVHVVEA